jgi:glutamyl-tRNA reductase
VSNRTRANAQALAVSLGGTATHFPPAEEDIAWADVIVCATSSPDAAITADLARKALLRRKDPSVILDLAVPRDVEPSLTNTENAYVYSVDDFQELVETNLRARQKEAIRAEKLIEKQVEEFVEWYRENRIAPTIQQLQEVLEGIRSTEVENNARRFCSDDREQVEKFSKSLIQKVTSLIIANMKQARVDGKDLSLAQAVSQAFAPPDGGDVKDVIEKLNHELSH